MNAIICQAISKKKVITFNYGGNNKTVEPHCLGVTTAGKPGLRAYQVGGHSSSGKMGWKMFETSKISSLVVLDKNFDSPRSGYQKNDAGMSLIECQL